METSKSTPLSSPMIDLNITSVEAETSIISNLVDTPYELPSVIETIKAKKMFN